MTICFFEDEGDRLFAPLTLTRPVDDLRVGIFTIREKWQRYLNISHFTRVQRVPLIRMFPADLPGDNRDLLWINARWLPDSEAAGKVKKLNEGQTLRKDGRTVAARLSAAESRKQFENGPVNFDPYFANETESGSLVNFLWDLFLYNETEIRKDIALLKSAKTSTSSAFPQAILVKPENIYAEPGVRVDPGAIIDASAGPVYLGRDSHIMSGAILQGPGAVCHQSVLKIGAKIYPGTTIGPVCKAGGEIHNVIMHSHSNKAHDGYLGNSLIGEWCNLGANTSTSNLKNNYKPVKIPDWATGNVNPSSVRFFGTVMGDHVKTAINTALSAGTLLGVCCNIFTYRFPPNHVPSFSWVSPDGIVPYQFDKAMETAEIMMTRRKIPLQSEYKLMMKYLFDHRKKPDDQHT
ncbi:MAG: putative sugar nucleotidyl transferase [Balneolales bacterium]